MTRRNSITDYEYDQRGLITREIRGNSSGDYEDTDFKYDKK